MEENSELLVKAWEQGKSKPLFEKSRSEFGVKQEVEAHAPPKVP